LATTGSAIGRPLVQASVRGHAKPAPALGSPVVAPRPRPAARRTARGIALPSAGAAPTISASHVAGRRAPAARRTVHRPAIHKPAPALLPERGTVIHSTAPPGTPAGKAEVNGHVHIGPRHTGAGRLLVPAPLSSPPAKATGFTPTAFYSSTQLDNFSASCGFGVNETTIAQATDNPNLMVAGANTYYDNAGNCQDSHAGVYYSSDGGQHWRFQVMPGLLDPSSGDPVVTYDPVRRVFVFAFVEFSRSDATVGRIGVEVSSDGVSWSRNTTLDANHSSYGTDKPSITVDQNPGSPHFGRVAVTWTQFFGNNAVYQDDYTDDGGATWHTDASSINFTTHECGNGTSSAFDANGDLMVAWADCSGGVNSMYEELSTDGGAHWTASSDTQITTTNPVAGAEDPNAADCLLDNGGSAFRCNSFPTLAGDPNSGDAGGTAFVVSWADETSTTQNSQTATVSQIRALSTINGGTNWDHPAFMNSLNFGDKFFPAASFSPSGRLNVSYSSREDDASSGNPNGKKYNEHQTEAGSLTNLRAASYVTYTTDGTLGDPGSLAFIGDYAGNTSLDQNFDTFPIWTDVRSGLPSARTQDLCYAGCMTFLGPDAPLSLSRTTGSTFADFYSISMDPSTGSGSSFWNVVGIRTGSDGTSVDDDMFLAPNRYFNASLASSAFGLSRNDYLVINGNAGHAPNTAYFPQVHSFSGIGGSYSIEWDAGHLSLGTSLTASMGSADVARIYDSFLSTGTNYFFGLRPNSGSTSGYSLALHSGAASSFQGRGSSVADSGNVAPGAPAFIQYNTGSDASQFDGLVAVNNNSGSGSYTLYRDTAAPSGTIKIDGGAASTTSTTLHLSLSATNPTSGDPVSEMAFSVNGGAFGAFRPFASTATVTAPSGEGVKTVSVEYRNGAGAVGPAASDTIYLVTSPPTVTAVSPSNGPTSGGNTVTLTGTHFAPGATVKFDTLSGTAVTFVTATKLTVKAPPHAIGRVHIQVTTPAGTSPVTTAGAYAYGVPTVSSVTPNGGSTSGGNTVTILGTNFTPTSTVVFSSAPGTAVTFVSAAKLTAKAPAHAAGTVSVSVTNAAGRSAASTADEYAYGAPTVTSISPHGGPTTGGTIVTVHGTGFVPGATVHFNTPAGTAVTIVNPTQLTVKAPAHAAATVNVRVTTPGGTSAVTSADAYTYS
jgi:hypothetical protein